MRFRSAFALGLFLISTLFAEVEQPRVYVMDRLTPVAAGSLVEVPVQVMNLSHRCLVLVNEFDLPPGITPLDSNDRYTHLNPFQTYNQLMRFKVDERVSPGRYRFLYRIFSETDVNLYSQDEGFIVVEEPIEIPCEEVCQELIFSEGELSASPNEMVYLPVVIHNGTDEVQNYQLNIKVPQGWQLVQFSNDPIALEPGEDSFQIVGLKVSSKAVAGEYTIVAELKGAGTSVLHEMKISICSVFEFIASVILEEEDSCLLCENRSNSPIAIEIQVATDPICPCSIEKSVLTIDAHESVRVRFEVDIGASADEEKQFVLFKIFKEGTDQQLYQVSYSFDLVSPSYSEDDPFMRIPSRMRWYALGENSTAVGVVEVSGCGVYDEEKGRIIDYCFRLPTRSRNVIYSVDQRLYLNLSDPTWNLTLGDTSYSLTPLTQYYRYGRGAGFDLYSGEVSFGAHYTQNTFSNDYDPLESCAYVEYSPTSWMSVSGNYLHKILEDNPTSNIVTVDSEIEFSRDVVLEVEVGNNFLNSSHDTCGLRGEVRGRVLNDAWFDCEKVYAGYDFLGYYQAMNLFSSTVDFPVSTPALRANLSYTSLRQNFASQDPDDAMTYSPRQKQGNMTLTYNFFNGMTFALNGMALKAHEVGAVEEYNFDQKWIGANFLVVQGGYTFNSAISLGQQKDYLTGKTTHCLQRYYIYLGRELTDRLFASCFYEGGHIDYFDVLPWRTTLGGSLRFRYQQCSWIDILAQHVRHRHSDYQLSQLSFNWHHEFYNHHSVDVSLQRFYYKHHYPSDSYFLVSYSIPFGLKLFEKGDRGDLNGVVLDTWNQCPVPNAIVNLNGKQTRSDGQGKFCFPRTSVGTQTIKTDYLPSQLTAKNPVPGEIQICKGKGNEITLECTPSAVIEGGLTLFGFSEESYFSEESQLLDLGGLSSVRVVIDLEHGKEIYTTLTDSNGRFKFAKLRPGSWRLYIDNERIPSLHYLSLNDLSIEVKPGETKKIECKVLPEKRVMQAL